jgi:hypothetical protein
MRRGAAHLRGLARGGVDTSAGQRDRHNSGNRAGCDNSGEQDKTARRTERTDIDPRSMRRRQAARK